MYSCDTICYMANTMPYNIHRVNYNGTQMFAGTHFPEGETKIYHPPSNLVFKLSEEELRQIIPAYTVGKRM